MPESASAVSQIAEEEHSWGKGNETENVAETAKRGKKIEIGEKAAARCLVIQDGWCQKSEEAAPGIRSLEGGKTCGRGRGQAQHGMRQKPRIWWGWSSETPLAQRFLHPRVTACQADWWLLEFYFLLKIRRQSIAKMSLIRGKQRLLDRLQ